MEISIFSTDLLSILPVLKHKLISQSHLECFAITKDRESIKIYFFLKYWRQLQE